MISFCPAALTHVNAALRTSLPDTLAPQISDYGIVKPHFNFISRHMSSLFINSRALPFLIELLPSVIVDTFSSPFLLSLNPA